MGRQAIDKHSTPLSATALRPRPAPSHPSPNPKVIPRSTALTRSPSLTSRSRRPPHSHTRAASEYGAVLDMVVDRASTAGFLVVLGVLYPQHLFVFQALLALDFTSHWMHMKRYARVSCARAPAGGHMSAGNTRPPPQHMATPGVVRKGTMRWFCGLYDGAHDGCISRTHGTFRAWHIQGRAHAAAGAPKERAHKGRALVACHSAGACLFWRVQVSRWPRLALKMHWTLPGTH